MNKLLQKFARQVGFGSDENGEIYTSALEHLPITEDLDAFAELIVRECIECTKEWRDAVRAESTNDYSQGYVHGCDDAIVEMKTRFGVEE